MKKHIKLTILTWLFVCLAGLVMTAEAQAVTPSIIGSRKGLLLLTKPVQTTVIPLNVRGKTSKITKLKSSKKSLVKLKKQSFGSERKLCVEVTPKKAGKTVISFKVKNGKKSRKLKYTATIIRYKNPLAELKIDGKNYASVFARTNEPEDDIILRNADQTVPKQLSIVPADGWKLVGIDWDADTIENNSEVIVFEEGSLLEITMKNMKKGYTITCYTEVE